jgi:hypothetical protein
MSHHNLKIPNQIFDLVERGIWPRSTEDSNKQHFKELISLKKLKEFAPDEKTIFFYPPPFIRISDALEKEGYEDYWYKYGAIDQIDPKLSLVISDFGIGSDTCLIIDYRKDINSPLILRLVWSDKNYWVKVADSFEEFCIISGLKN